MEKGIWQTIIARVSRLLRHVPKKPRLVPCALTWDVEFRWYKNNQER